MPKNKLDCSDKTDEELIDLILKNQDYFICLINRYQSRLFKFIFRITNVSREEAEDILQEVFIKVYKNINEVDRSLKFSSWIYRITYNQVVSNYRKNRARPEYNAIAINDNALNQLAVESDIKGQINQQYLRNNIIKIISKLDVKYQEVLILRFWEEKDYQEMSDILKKPQGTIATLLNRAKQAFRQELAKQELELDL
jgi:RNA polymerase sigma-70 factor, ECF subfamily